MPIAAKPMLAFAAQLVEHIRMAARTVAAVLALLATGRAFADDAPLSCLEADRSVTGPILAIELYSRCLAEPGLPQDRTAIAHYRRGLAFQTNNQLMEAAIDLSEALSLRSQWAEAHRARALVMLALNELDEADEHLTAALRIDPDFAEARKDRAILSSSMGDFSRALEDLAWAIRTKPVFPEAYLQRGLVHFHQKRFALAVDDLDQAITLKRDYGEAHHARGLARHSLRDYAAAIDDFSRALDTRHPQPWLVLSSRAQTYEKMRDRLFAIADLREALALNPRFDQARSQLHRLGVSAYPGRPDLAEDASSP